MNHSDDEKLLYRVALETRAFEIDLFWRRSNYFLVLSTAIAIGFFTQEQSDHSFLLALFGLLVSILWVHVNLGSKYWQSRWEERAAITERSAFVKPVLFGAPESLIKEDVKAHVQRAGHWWMRRIIDRYMIATKPSVSFLMLLLSGLFVLFWLAALAIGCFEQRCSDVIFLQATNDLAPRREQKMEYQQLIALVKDIVLGLAAAITAAVAIIGLHKWRKELRGRAEFDTARGLARATYRLRDELARCRSPLVRASEFPPAYPGPGANPQAEADAWGHVYKNRWDPVFAALQDYDAQVLEAEALWGSPIREAAEQLSACVRTLVVAIEAMLGDKASGGRDFGADREFAKKVRSEVSASSTDTQNPLTMNIASAVVNIERHLRPHLSRK